MDEESLIRAYQDTLNITVDGGNTEVLNYEVITSLPEEALVLRQDLLDESPYLSDTVMVSAIQNEEVLPAAMVRDILVVNPQAPKSRQIMTFLEQRQDTLPAYMMDEILQGIYTFGAKELLEQKLGNHIDKRARSWDKLNHYYKNDTASMGAASDSLISLLQHESRINAKYHLSFIYLSQHDSLQLFESLENIPNEFVLTNQQLGVYNEYVELFEILWQISSDSIALDSAQIQNLFDLSAASHDLPGIYASNLLIKEGLLNYHEPIYDVNILKSTSASYPDPKSEVDRGHLMVFPNPAGTYFIADYDLTDFQNEGILSITDIKGRQIRTIRLKDKHNQVVVPVVDFAAGTYLVKLLSGNSVIETKKILLGM